MADWNRRRRHLLWLALLINGTPNHGPVGDNEIMIGGGGAKIKKMVGLLTVLIVQ